MTTTANRAQRILDAADSCIKVDSSRYKLEDVRLHFEGYAEPGYTDPDSGIIATGDWNPTWKKGGGIHEYEDDTMPRVAKLFEKLGIELEWDDEWVMCDQCCKLVRTQPNSYGWQPSYYAGDDGDLCLECVDPVAVLSDLEGKPHMALQLDINPEDHGYVKANDQDYENGWYGGQDDSPNAIAEALEELGITRYLFRIDSVGQFDTRLSVYVHEDEAERLRGSPEGKCKEDPAQVMSRGLQAASRASGELKGEGIRYVKVHGDGTASARLVSDEEFVSGIN